MWYIYVLCDPREPDPIKRVRYVGKANNLKKRYYVHKREAKTLKTHRARWFLSILHLGLNPVMEVVESGCDDEKWKEAECRLIANFKELGCCLTNGTDGGDGVRMTPEIRLKQSNSMKKWINSEAGKLHLARMRAASKTPEALEKARESKRNRRLTEEHKTKIAAAGVGRFHSEETKRKMTEAAKLRWSKIPPEQRILTDEHRQKVATAGKGRKFSDEHRQRLSESLKRRHAMLRTTNADDDTDE